MKVFKTTTSKRSYIAEQIDPANCIVRVDDALATAIGTFPLDLFEESEDWQEDLDHSSLHELFQSFNPKTL